MKLKEYKDFNKSLWFLFPIIVDEVLLDNKKENARVKYLIDTHLINTYIYPSQEERLLYVKYQNSPEVVDIEPYLTCDYLVDIKYNITSTVYIYNIKGTNPIDLDNMLVHDLFVDGKYSEISLDHKWKMYRFFRLQPYDFLTKIIKRDDRLWHEIYRNLGCGKEASKNKCTCRISTHVEKINGVDEIMISANQTYMNCEHFESFKMPNRMSIELEEKINEDEETIIL